MLLRVFKYMESSVKEIVSRSGVLVKGIAIFSLLNRIMRAKRYEMAAYLADSDNQGGWDGDGRVRAGNFRHHVKYGICTDVRHTFMLFFVCCLYGAGGHFRLTIFRGMITHNRELYGVRTVFAPVLMR